MGRLLGSLLRKLIRTPGAAPERTNVQEDESRAWPPSMRGVKAVWTPKGYVLHRIKPDGTNEIVRNNQHHGGKPGLPGYGGTPPGVGYG